MATVVAIKAEEDALKKRRESAEKKTESLLKLGLHLFSVKIQNMSLI
ncbi:MAG: hypothetical protein IKI37_04745 [Oscillospiraceae bacterium]|nr:hypothetical protein [Oscillospiraceae bacterium]